MAEAQRQFLERVLRGNRDAVAFIETLAGISQVLDDLVDRDAEVTAFEIVDAFWDALVTVASNPFYQRHFDGLQPLVRQTLLDWLAANGLEKGDRHARSLAFVLRDSLTGLVHYCAYLIGGLAWAAEVGPAIRLYFHDEPLEEYLEKLTDERQETKEAGPD